MKRIKRACIYIDKGLDLYEMTYKLFLGRSQANFFYSIKAIGNLIPDTTRQKGTISFYKNNV